jgi:threonine aldolase
MNFASDNAAGVAPAILEAIAAANSGFALAYGDDAATRGVERRFCELFEREVAVFLVPTGTAANALALAHVTPPWGAVMCHREAHVISNECGAPEFFGGGLRLVGLDGEGGKIAPETLALALDRHEGHSPHQVVPAMVSLTQATEAGTVYHAGEVAALCALAHERGLAVHMDGARFANAVVHLGVTPAQATWQAGIDVLSFGATKGGALAAEAVIFFDPARAVMMAERRKRAGHLVSKHRFIAAQLEAFLTDGLWLDLARHANRMADCLAATLADIGIVPVWKVEANLVFVLLPQALHAHLQAAGAQYYAFHSDSLPGGRNIPAGHVLARLVTSFSTTEADIEAFASHAKRTRSRPSFA